MDPLRDNDSLAHADGMDTTPRKRPSATPRTDKPSRATTSSRIKQKANVDNRSRSPVRGTVVAIFTAPAKGTPTIARDTVRAVAGRGLEGDRYFLTNQADHDPKDEITMIDAESLRLARSEHGVDLDAGQHRRNLVIDGIELPETVGRTIKVGDAQVEVLANNPPCKYLQNLTGQPVLRVLRHDGGVRGRIAVDGTIRLGDSIQAPPSPQRRTSPGRTGRP
jgi:MOSC domain-containing protein YiiM